MNDIMPDRIKKLANHAGFDFGRDWQIIGLNDYSLKAYTELLIKECFNVVNDFALQQASEPENTLGENLFVSIKITDAAHKIKEHFGVE